MNQTFLKNVLSFTGLVVGVAASLPHLLNVNQIGIIPEILLPGAAGFTITADATNVTVTRSSDAPSSLLVYCKAWHTIENEGPDTSAFWPFVAAGGGGGALPLAFSNTVDGNALTNSNVATSILAANALPLFPANFWQIGRQVRIKAAGRCSNIITTPGTLTLDLRMVDSAVVTVVAFNGGTTQLAAVAKTNVPWFLDILLTCRVAGAAAQLEGQGTFTSQSVVGSGTELAGSTGAGTAMLPNATPGLGTAFNGTLANTLDLFGTFSLPNANNIQLTQFSCNQIV